MTRAHRVLLVASAGMFMASLDLFIVNIAFPDIRADFGGTSLASLSWVLNAYAIVFAALLVPMGRLADLIGRKRVFLIGLGVFTAASALCAAAPSVGFLIGARVLQAVGGAMLMPTSLSLVLPEFPPERRAAAVGIWAATGAFAAAAGPPLGGLLVELSWRWVFLVNLPVAAVVAVAAVRVLREARDPDATRLPDLVGSAMIVAGVGALTLAIVKGPDWGWSSPEIVGLLAAAAVLVPAFLYRSARHVSPVVDVSMLRVRSFALANAAGLLFFAAFGAMLLSGVLWLTGVWHYSVLTAGLALAPGPFTAGLFAVPSGRLADRFGQRAVGHPGRARLRRQLRLARVAHGPRARIPDGVPPGPAARRRGRRPDDPVDLERGGGVAPARALRDRLGDRRHVAPDRRGARRGDPRGRARDAHRRRRSGRVPALVDAHGDRVRRRGAHVRGDGPGARDRPGRHARRRGRAMSVLDAPPTRTKTVDWADPVELARRARSMSGLEVMEAIGSGELPPPPIASLIGFEPPEVSEGHARFTLRAGEEHYNPIGVVHGGVGATMLDSAMGCAVHTTLPAGVGYTTLEIKVNYVRAAHAGMHLVAEADVVHRGRSVATAEGRLIDGETGKLLAHATTTCLIIGG